MRSYLIEQEQAKMLLGRLTTDEMIAVKLFLINNPKFNSYELARSDFYASTQRLLRYIDDENTTIMLNNVLERLWL